MTDFGQIKQQRQVSHDPASGVAPSDGVQNQESQGPVNPEQSNPLQSPRQASESERRSRLQESAFEGEARRAALSMQSQQGTSSSQTASPAQFIQQHLDGEMIDAGLSRTERQGITRHLNQLNGQEQMQEINFLRDHVLNSPNASRALHVYGDLIHLRSQNRANQDRITPEIVHTLTRGVSETRSGANGREGILGRDGAVRAAEVLTRLQASEYDQIVDLLGRTGKPVGPEGRPQGDNPQMERALILKALAARQNEFQSRGSQGTPMQEINRFAEDIRGLSREELIRQTTTLAIEGRQQLGVFGQVDGRTCVPASAQITRAEADPIYALYLTNSANASNVASEQRSLLRAHDSDQSNGINNPIEHGDVLNSVAGNQTGRVYQPAYIPRETEFDARQAEIRGEQGRLIGRIPVVQPQPALDHITELLRDGIDVPITTRPPGQSQQHAMVITDVREGANDSRSFLITDPSGGGRTFWVDQAALQARSRNDQGWSPFLGSWVNYFDPAKP